MGQLWSNREVSLISIIAQYSQGLISREDAALALEERLERAVKLSNGEFKSKSFGNYRNIKNVFKTASFVLGMK